MILNRTSNKIMWLCFIDILKGVPDPNTARYIHMFIDSYVKYDGREVEYNFSHDNWTLVLCWLHRFDPKKKHQIPLFGHHTKHPMRLVDFIWMKYPLPYPLILITIVDMLFRHLVIRRKTSEGRYHTSGLLLDYYVFYSYERSVAMWLLTLCMKTMYRDWDEVFREYHGNPVHYNYRVYVERKRRSKWQN